MHSTPFDFAIIGAGAAGLQLALAMNEDPWFKEKRVLILEKDAKNISDKTWCFWEKGEGKWGPLISKSWSKGKFITREKEVLLDLPPFHYKMINALDFYKHARDVLQASQNFEWRTEEVTGVSDQNITTNQGVYVADQIFDSTIDPVYKETKGKYVTVLQHFKGWFISSKEDIFDPETFVMMDYRLKQENTTSFMYVLPKSKNEALIEFTYFSPELVEESTYDQYLEKYLKEILRIKNYTISSSESGVIPMSMFPFHKSSRSGLLKIGTAGSWVKPSSGYSFRNTQRVIEKLIRNIKSGSPLSKGLLSPKFRLYDTMFLDILERDNSRGEELFRIMYTKNGIHEIFDFLDEKTSILRDLKIMSTFPPAPFMKSVVRQIF